MPERVYKTTPEQRARSRQWQLDNPERAKANRQRYYQANKERVAELTRAWSAANREHKNAVAAAWRARNPEKMSLKAKSYRARYPDKVRDAKLRREFGISLEEYNARLSSQGGRCGICGQEDGRRSLAVDHCHRTGKVRGLLCRRCNTSLGQFEDNVELLTAAITYLKEHGG